ncbi:MAG: hypothetical protein K0Q72_2315, partial [Armatimonadetes bacterium]|nr:hypothetical protein [Armatimonadota bacterium]
AALLVGLAVPAWALAGSLDRPGIAFAGSYPAAAREKVMAVLDRKDAKFVDGNFVNAWTSLRYRGDVRAANMFVGELAGCPGVTVSVSLKRLPEDCDWRVGHDAHTNRFQIEVNLASPRLELEELVIPATKGPELPAPAPPNPG